MTDLELGPGMARGVDTKSPGWTRLVTEGPVPSQGWVSWVVPGHLPQLAEGSRGRCASRGGTRLVHPTPLPLTDASRIHAEPKRGS